MMGLLAAGACIWALQASFLLPCDDEGLKKGILGILIAFPSPPGRSVRHRTECAVFLVLSLFFNIFYFLYNFILIYSVY